MSLFDDSYYSVEKVILDDDIEDDIDTTTMVELCNHYANKLPKSRMLKDGDQSIQYLQNKYPEFSKAVNKYLSCNS